MKGDAETIADKDYCTVSFPYDDRVKLYIDGKEVEPGVKLVPKGEKIEFTVEGTSFEYEENKYRYYQIRTFYADYSTDKFIPLLDKETEIYDPNDPGKDYYGYTYELIIDNNTDILYTTHYWSDETGTGLSYDNRLSIDLRYCSAFIEKERILVGPYEFEHNYNVNTMATPDDQLDYLFTSGGIPVQNHFEVGRSCDIYLDKITVLHNNSAIRVVDGANVSVTTLEVFDNSMTSENDPAVFVEEGSQIHFNIPVEGHSLKLSSKTTHAVSGDGNIFIDTVKNSFLNLVPRDETVEAIKGISLTVDCNDDVISAAEISEIYSFAPSYGTHMAYLQKKYTNGTDTPSSQTVVEKDDTDTAREYITFVVEFRMPDSVNLGEGSNGDLGFSNEGNYFKITLKNENKSSDEKIYERGIARKYLTEAGKDNEYDSLSKGSNKDYTSTNGVISIKAEKCYGLLVVTLATTSEISYTVDGTDYFVYDEGVKHKFPTVSVYAGDGSGKNIAKAEYVLNGVIYDEPPEVEEAGEYVVTVNLSAPGSNRKEHSFTYTVTIDKANNDWVAALRVPCTPQDTTPVPEAKSRYLSDQVVYKYLPISEAKDAGIADKWQLISDLENGLPVGRYLVKAEVPESNNVHALTSGIIPLVVTKEFIAVASGRVLDKYVQNSSSHYREVGGADGFTIFYQLEPDDGAKLTLEFYQDDQGTPYMLPNGTRITLIDFTYDSDGVNPDVYYCRILEQNKYSSVNLSNFVKTGIRKPSNNTCNHPGSFTATDKIDFAQYQVCVDLPNDVAESWDTIIVKVKQTKTSGSGENNYGLASDVTIKRDGTGIWGGELAVTYATEIDPNESDEVLSADITVDDKENDTIDVAVGNGNALSIQLRQGSNACAFPIGSYITLTHTVTGEVTEPLEIREDTAFFSGISAATYRVDVYGLPTGTNYGMFIWLSSKPSMENDYDVDRYPFSYSYTNDYVTDTSNTSHSRSNYSYGGDYFETAHTHKVYYKKYVLALNRVGENASNRVLDLTNGEQVVSLRLTAGYLDSVDAVNSTAVSDIPINGEDAQRISVVLLDVNGNEINITPTVNDDTVSITFDDSMLFEDAMGTNYTIKAVLYIDNAAVFECIHKVVITKG